jgi:hypothetical protein
MLRSTARPDRLYLTEDLRAAEAMTVQPMQKAMQFASVGRFATEVKRFPPVEDVMTAIDRIASRTFLV